MKDKDIKFNVIFNLTQLFQFKNATQFDIIVK